MLRLLVMHSQCVPLVVLLDECHHASDRDWDITHVSSVCAVPSAVG